MASTNIATIFVDREFIDSWAVARCLYAASRRNPSGLTLGSYNSSGVPSGGVASWEFPGIESFILPKTEEAMQCSIGFQPVFCGGTKRRLRDGQEYSREEEACEYQVIGSRQTGSLCYSAPARSASSVRKPPETALNLTPFIHSSLG